MGGCGRDDPRDEKLSAATILLSLSTIPKQRSVGWLAISNTQPALIQSRSRLRAARERAQGANVGSDRLAAPQIP
jgi:hypothetical protein